MPTLYDELGGFDQILALTHRWHALCLEDPLAGHPFQHDIHPHHSLRLAAYLAEAFGGPALYSAGYGTETEVQKIHACNGEHIELDEACLRAFDQALADCNMTGQAGQRASDYFRRATESQRVYAHSKDAVPENLPFNFE